MQIWTEKMSECSRLAFEFVEVVDCDGGQSVVVPPELSPLSLQDPTIRDYWASNSQVCQEKIFEREESCVERHESWGVCSI